MLARRVQLNHGTNSKVPILFIVVSKRFPRSEFVLDRDSVATLSP